MTRPARTACAVALLVALAGTLLAVGRAQQLAQEISLLRAEVDARRSELRDVRRLAESRVQRTGSRTPAVDDRFRTWSHLIAAVHESAASCRLDRFHYRTGKVLPPDTASGTERRMTARISGRGAYRDIVGWVSSLPQVSPPLGLERLEIRAAEEGAPRFEAVVSLETQLSIEVPRLIALGDSRGEEGER